MLATEVIVGKPILEYAITLGPDHWAAHGSSEIARLKRSDPVSM